MENAPEPQIVKDKPPAKIMGRVQEKWNLATNEKGTMAYMTITIPVQYAANLEFWARKLLEEKEIITNSPYAAGRFVMMAGIEALDAEYQKKYGGNE